MSTVERFFRFLTTEDNLNFVKLTPEGFTIMKQLVLSAQIESWPITGKFTISRGSKTHADVIIVTLTDGVTTGYGECVPYQRYDETMEGVMAEIMAMETALASAISRTELLKKMPAGAARNAIDCALWDFECKSLNTSISQQTAIAIEPLITAYTISYDDADEMARKVSLAEDYSLLKLKLGGSSDKQRIEAIRKAAPDKRLIIDANEGWTQDTLKDMLKVCADNGIELVEQPLPDTQDYFLAELEHIVPICADESVHEAVELEILSQFYDAVNIKLDKTGGLTAALEMVRAAKSHNLQIMVGCMVGTSLAMAPAMVIAQYADYVDLDGPLLLQKDREHGLVYAGSLVEPPSPLLWG